MKFFLRFGLAPGAIFGAAAQDTPGFDFLGFGYNMLEGNLLTTTGEDGGWKSKIFAFERTSGAKTEDGKWTIPDKTTSQSLSACSLSMAQTFSSSVNAYHHEVGSSFDIGGGYNGIDFSFDADSEHIRETTDTKQSLFAHSTMQCSVYKLRMNTFDVPGLDKNFLAAVDYLPSEYNAGSQQKYMKVLDAFGTDVVVGMVLGGRWGFQTEFHYDKFQDMLDDGTNIGASLTAMTYAHAKIGSNSSTNVTTGFLDSITKNTTYNTGGDFSPDVDTWEKTVRASPMPIHVSTMAISDLLQSPYMNDSKVLANKQAGLAKAAKDYCSYLVASKGKPKSYCEPPPVIPMPVPHVTPKTSINRVCVTNEGIYALYVQAVILKTAQATWTGWFSKGYSRCIDGFQLGATNGQLMSCNGHAGAGSTVPCEGNGHVYDSRSKMGADYVCTGSTTTIRCSFQGLSETDPEMLKNLSSTAVLPHVEIVV